MEVNELTGHTNYFKRYLSDCTVKGILTSFGGYKGPERHGVVGAHSLPPPERCLSAPCMATPEASRPSAYGTPSTALQSHSSVLGIPFGSPPAPVSPDGVPRQEFGSQSRRQSRSGHVEVEARGAALRTALQYVICMCALRNVIM